MGLIEILDPKRAAKGQWWDRALSLVEGCSVVSEGCANCWAATQSHIRSHQSNEKIIARYSGLTTGRGKWNGKVRMMWDDIKKPLHVKRPTIWAVWNDLFHEGVCLQFHLDFINMVADCPQHTFVVLTKRPERALDVLWSRNISVPPNVIIGTSAENQELLYSRLKPLSLIPSRLVLSLEPMLDKITILGSYHMGYTFDWVIVGCESGPNRRPCKIEWVESIVEQCQTAGVPVWVKQLNIDGKVEHDMAKFPAHLQHREMP